MAWDGDGLGSGRWRLEAGISREQEHANGDLEDGVVLSGVLRVIPLQQAAAHGGARACKLGQVQVSKAQLGISLPAFQLLAH